MNELLLLPPSEGEAPEGRGKWTTGSGTFRGLKAAREEVATALREAMDDAPLASKVLGLKGVALQDARAANRHVVGAHTLPAHQRYTGVVWSYLQQDLSDEAWQRASDSVVVPSGLLGLAAWNDPVPHYKAKIGARLPGVGVLNNYWRPLLGKALRKRYKNAVAVNLLPNDYSKAIDFEAIGLAHRIDVEFVDGNRKAVGHNAKAVKGLLAAHLLENADPFDAIESFVAMGWQGSITAHGPHQTQATITLVNY